jgi:hypothetical protein
VKQVLVLDGLFIPLSGCAPLGAGTGFGNFFSLHIYQELHQFCRSSVHMYQANMRTESLPFHKLPLLFGLFSLQQFFCHCLYTSLAGALYPLCY